MGAPFLSLCVSLISPLHLRVELKRPFSPCRGGLFGRAFDHDQGRVVRGTGGTQRVTFPIDATGSWQMPCDRHTAPETLEQQFRKPMKPSGENGDQGTIGTSMEGRLAVVRERMAEAAARAGRAVEDVTLVAVSKTHPPAAIGEAVAAGQTLFGESRVQEARAKIPLSPGRARWHFIGHLQKNKIRHALPLFELFHGIDSMEIAREMERIAAEDGMHPRVLLEVNVAGEGSKFGFSPGKLRTQMEELLALRRLNIEGLMCIPPPQPDADGSREFFIALRELRDRIQVEFRVPLPQLSMGMSGDYAVAIAEGATFIRVGTAIFGARSGKTWKPETGAGQFED